MFFFFCLHIGLASAGVNIVLIVLTVILVIFVIVLWCYSFYQKKRGAYNLINPNFFTDTPGTVSVSVQNHDGPLREGQSYKLRCDVSSVAPAAALTVSWLRRGEIVKTQTYEEYLKTKTPKNVSSTLEVTAYRNNMNEMITCRTTFDPKQEGPSEQFNTSKSYQVIVNCKLVIF